MITATRANMRAHPGYTAVSLFTDEEYSADANDYFLMEDDCPLLDDAGEPMVLAKRQSSWEFAS